MAAREPYGYAADMADASGGSVKADLRRILDLTGRMLEKARAGEWDDLIALESLRRPIVAQCFDSSRHALFDAEDATGIQALRDLNDDLLEVGRVRSRELVKILSDNGHQRRVADHYRRAGKG